MRFQFDGQATINETHSPAQLEMEDQSTTDVFEQQNGGLHLLAVPGLAAQVEEEPRERRLGLEWGSK
ncbi:rCG48964, partial [Rattus norvegicus]